MGIWLPTSNSFRTKRQAWCVRKIRCVIKYKYVVALPWILRIFQSFRVNWKARQVEPEKVSRCAKSNFDPDWHCFRKEARKTWKEAGWGREKRSKETSILYFLNVFTILKNARSKRKAWSLWAARYLINSILRLLKTTLAKIYTFPLKNFKVNWRARGVEPKRVLWYTQNRVHLSSRAIIFRKEAGKERAKRWSLWTVR